MLTKATKAVKVNEITRRWYIVDAKGKVLGRLASKVASVLMGKGKVNQSPNVDSGDYVIVINASKVAVTGRKESDKMYYRHSGYPGGLKSANLAKVREEKPEELIRHAVSGMVPHTRLGRLILKKLHVYPGEKHEHEAQKPEKLEI
ncbi:MAG: 50S ribosomal protein L13 [Patescibacteria group bacterium]|nr:50S ribosomal protein L13 [Patescibacteria group bacterium]